MLCTHTVLSYKTSRWELLKLRYIMDMSDPLKEGNAVD